MGKTWSSKETACVYSVIIVDRSNFLPGPLVTFQKRQLKARIAPKEDANLAVSLLGELILRAERKYDSA
tara:strand:- start:130632 stop:130838 length:207 start_codon:yes stop_codon:yes gene_type:complete